MNFTSVTHKDTYPAIAQSNHHGRTMLITGASRGIGRATAISFAKSGASNIIIAARSGLYEVEQDILSAAATTLPPSTPQVLKIHLDVTSENSVDSAAVTVMQKFPLIDILINNAGYLENWHHIAESDTTEWWKSWNVNIKGAYLITRRFLPLVLKSETKTIVNISSIGAHRTRVGASAYQTAKFALLRFTEFVATEYEDQGIVAVSIHPGGVPTELALKMPESIHVALTDKPQLAADTITWLTQDRKEWLSGRYISVNWDMPELVSKKDEIVDDDKLKMRIVI